MNEIPETAPPPVPDHELIRCVGRGGYGEVWLARSVMGTFRAVKIVRRETFDEARPFEREFEGISRYEPVSRLHPGWVDILHVGRGTDYFYYVMELADDVDKGARVEPEGYTPRTLGRVLQRRGSLPAGECVEIGVALAAALEHLHSQGLVHRDIKPSNIIFVHGSPKFADIGLVTRLGESATFVGTAGYIAPEGPGRAQADVYSLGKVLYEAAMGKEAGQFPELPTTFREMPEAPALARFNDVIVQACHPDLARRYPGAAEMRRALEALRAGGPARAPASGSDTAVAREAGGGAVVLLACGGGEGRADTAAMVSALERRGLEVYCDPRGAPSVDWARRLEERIGRAGLVLVVAPRAGLECDMLVYGLEWARQMAAQRRGVPAVAVVRVEGDPPALWPPWAACMLEGKPVLGWKGAPGEEQFCGDVLELLEALKE